MLTVTRRDLIFSSAVGAVATSARLSVGGEVSGALTYPAAEAAFLTSPWAMLMKERIGCLIDLAENTTATRVQLLSQVGVAVDHSNAWAIGGQEAAAAIGGIRLARLVVHHGLATEAESRSNASEILDLWRRCGPGSLSAASRRPRWEYVADPKGCPRRRWRLRA